MRELSFFLLKNAFGAKMKKGFRNLCSGDDSTSAVNYRRTDRSSTCIGSGSVMDSPCLHPVVIKEIQSSGSGSVIDSPRLHPVTIRESRPTLEEMILQLELEEKAARRSKLDDYGEIRHRMSCVNSSDILRSARNALNQYPRFSLDGKDAMYRSSFRNMVPEMSNQGVRKGLPDTLAGETVVWCRPGVVGKLMGLEAMPIPVRKYLRRESRLTAVMKRKNVTWTIDDDEIDKIEKTKLVINSNDWDAKDKGLRASCSTTGAYCHLKPVRIDGHPNEEVGWPMRHFR